ncbi:hypothetical protein O3M35_008043 [Rhynocoris fuscipes]|uniref:Uncharacterized protein n=1 Tax=Rhynocoris fuscipes TaxID=488301 RepID=A0AAW1D4Z4_9HEMI
MNWNALLVIFTCLLLNVNGVPLLGLSWNRYGGAGAVGGLGKLGGLGGTGGIGGGGFVGGFRGGSLGFGK